MQKDNIFYLVHKDINKAIRFMQQDLDILTKYLFNNSINLNSQKKIYYLKILELI